MVEIPDWVLFVLAAGLVALFAYDLYCLYFHAPEGRRELFRSLVFDAILVAVIVPFAAYDIARGAHWTDITLDVTLAVLIAVVTARRVQLFRRTRPVAYPLGPGVGSG